MFCGELLCRGGKHLKQRLFGLGLKLIPPQLVHCAWRRCPCGGGSHDDGVSGGEGCGKESTLWLIIVFVDRIITFAAHITHTIQTVHITHITHITNITLITRITLITFSASSLTEIGQ